jgi:hypothetical protein
MIYYFLKNILHSTGATTTRELDICPWPDFSFVLGIFDPGTNEGICTNWNHRPVQNTPSQGCIGASYKCCTFVTSGATTQYKCGDICTSQKEYHVQI